MKKHLYLMIINALGIAMFFVIGKFIAIPTPIPNFALFLQYAILLVFGFYYGPIVGLSIGFFGHLLIDLISGYGLWFSWIISSGLFGLAIGFASKLINHLGNPFKPIKIIIFCTLVIISGAICWILIAPTGDLLFYQEPLDIVFLEGLVAFISNVVTALIIGLPIIYGLKMARIPYSYIKRGENNHEEKQ